jgi:hypothetical protein
MDALAFEGILSPAFRGRARKIEMPEFG